MLLKVSKGRFQPKSLSLIVIEICNLYYAGVLCKRHQPMTEGRKVGWTIERVDERMDRWRIYGWIGGKVEWMNRGIDGRRVNGWMDGQTDLRSKI